MDSGDRGQVDDIDIDEGRGCASQNVEVLFWSGRTGCLFYIFSGLGALWQVAYPRTRHLILYFFQ